MFATYVEWCRGTDLGHQTSRLAAAAVIGAVMIALVIRTLNKRSGRHSRPSDH